MASLSYEKAGVPHLKGEPSFTRKISQLCRSTHVPGVMGSSTGFAAVFDFKKVGIKDPLLVSSTDGVGTKLEIARLQGKHDTIGIDLVAMCVNDIVTYGAKPMFFLDYFATGKWNSKITQEVLKGIVKGCRDAGCALVGGETAIMPGFYNHGSNNGQFSQYDLAGFTVGAVDRKKIVTGKTIKKGDMLLGLASSGFHSNGYSLLRKVFSEKELKGSIGKSLLTPTKIYVKPVLAVVQAGARGRVPLLTGIVNITGGGLIDNLPRVIPTGLGACVYPKRWPKPKLFQRVQDSGDITDLEMIRTFNGGIGMILILKKNYLKKARTILKRHKVAAWVIGEIVKGKGVEVL